MPAETDEGSGVPSDTVKVSWSASVSCAVVMSAAPTVNPWETVMLVSVPMSPASAEPRVTVTGMVTSLPSAADSVATMVTAEPSATTGLSFSAESETVGVAAGGVVPEAARVTVTV